MDPVIDPSLIFLAPSLPPEANAGALRALSFARALAARDWTLLPVTRRRTRHCDDTLLDAMPVVAPVARSDSTLGQLRAALRHVDAVRPDGVFARVEDGTSALAAHLAARSTRLPLVLDIAPRSDTWFRGGGWRAPLLDGCRAVLLPDDASRARFCEAWPLLPEGRVLALPTPSEPALFDAGGATRQPVFSLLLFGLWGALPAPATLLAGVRQFFADARLSPDGAELRVLGQPAPEALIADAGLGPWARFEAPAELAPLGPLLRAADVLLVGDSQGAELPVALAAERPVVTAEDSAREVARALKRLYERWEHEGPPELTVPAERDPESLGARLDRCLRDAFS